MIGSMDKRIQNYIQNEATVFYLNVNLEGHILEANSFTKHLLGFDLVDKSVHDVFVDFTETIKIEKLAIESNKEVLLNIHTFTGIPQSLYLRFFQNEESILILGRTDHLELENLRKELLTLNNELNDLTRQLHKKNAELTKLNQLKNQFLGMAAHDLRKPAGIAKMYTEFLIEECGDDLSEEHRNFLQRILSSSGSMTQIINDFLDVSLIESGRFEVHQQTHDLISIIEDVLVVHKILGKKRGIRFVLETDETKVEVPVDVSKIEQVLTNLIQNSMEYSPENGKVCIQIDKANDRIIVSVKDQGPGLSPDVVENLFRPFGKGPAQKAMGSKSTGLGLVISKKIVEAHGGKIWVVSEQGEGASFIFTLPINK